MDISQTLSITKNLETALTMLDTRHLDSYEDSLLAAHMDNEEFTEMLTERTASQVTDYRIRHKDSTQDMVWHPKYRRMTKRSTAQRYTAEASK